MNKAQSRGPKTISPDLEEEFHAIARWAGCELLNSELAGGTLRLVIDREGGITHGDCETISKQISALLDVVDFGQQRYLLEVSSPGLDRPLYKASDYERFAGHRVRVTHYSDGRKETHVGRLEGLADGDTAVLELDDGERIELALDGVVKARLEIEL
ncbi:MAG: ribosome maturation factor RimP [Acidobacteriota bacterium]